MLGLAATRTGRVAACGVALEEQPELIAMDLRRHVSRALYKDHIETMALLLEFETLLGRHDRNRPPADCAALLQKLIRAVDTEIAPHFAFEEESVFPLLAAGGYREMGAVLLGEHQVILPLAQRLAAIAKPARAASFAASAWAEFHDIGAELIERLESHIKKEDMALLPALDDLLDDEEDGRLSLELATYH